MQEIIREINVMNMDVVVLTETKMKGTGSETLGNCMHLFSGVKKYERANLNEEIVKSGCGRQLILMGDMNGKTGRKSGDTVVGNFGEDRVNDDGERLI